MDALVSAARALRLSSVWKSYARRCQRRVLQSLWPERGSRHGEEAKGQSRRESKYLATFFSTISASTFWTRTKATAFSRNPELAEATEFSFPGLVTHICTSDAQDSAQEHTGLLPLLATADLEPQVRRIGGEEFSVYPVHSTGVLLPFVANTDPEVVARPSSGKSSGNGGTGLLAAIHSGAKWIPNLRKPKTGSHGLLPQRFRLSGTTLLKATGGYAPPDDENIYSHIQDTFRVQTRAAAQRAHTVSMMSSAARIAKETIGDMITRGPIRNTSFSRLKSRVSRLRSERESLGVILQDALAGDNQPLPRSRIFLCRQSPGFAPFYQHPEECRSFASFSNVSEIATDSASARIWYTENQDDVCTIRGASYRRCWLNMKIGYQHTESETLPEHLYVAGVEVSSEGYQGAVSQWSRQAGQGGQPESQESEAPRPVVAYAETGGSLVEAPFGVWVPVHEILGDFVTPIEEYGLYDCETDELVWEDAASRARGEVRPAAPRKPVRRRVEVSLQLYVLSGSPLPKLRAGIRAEYIPDYLYITQVIN